MLRWLLLVFTALALVGSSVTAWAAAGVIGDVSCCCPSPDACNCDDHDDEAPVLKRCSTDAKLVTPTIAPALAPAAIAVAAAVTVTPVASAPVVALPASPVYEPETPPF